jgi:hypothetical protein
MFSRHWTNSDRIKPSEFVSRRYRQAGVAKSWLRDRGLFLQWPEGRRQAMEGPGYGGEGMPYKVEGMPLRGERVTLRWKDMP